MKHIVYCYIDLRDGIVKYIGITSRKLISRIKEHEKNESWVSLSKWKISYFYVKTKSESEAWESHLIDRYETYKWYNTAKKDWGTIGAYRDIFPEWKTYMIKDTVVDIDYDRYQILDDIKGDDNLIDETTLMLDFNIDKDTILYMVGKRLLQILAVTSNHKLIFWKDAIEITKNYVN